MAVLSERIRRPAVAGYFYPGDAAALRDAVRASRGAPQEPQAACAVIVPHGSYAQCGMVLGATWAAVRIPRRVVLLGPAQTPAAGGWRVPLPGAWRTPLGQVPIDEAAVESLRSWCPELTLDERCHHGEHAAEVHLPFLQVLGPSDLAVTPIIAGDEHAVTCAAVAEALARLVRESHEPILLAASSDLSQFEACERGRAIDQALIEAACGLESVRLRQAVEASETAMCGLGAVSCVLEASRILGAGRGRLIAHRGSDETGGDPGSRTGYAGIVVA
jgi:AmmeMemoRadiSam system protein B